jgi:predicted permease
MLLKRPGFTLVAVVALALGIGANTTMFSLLNALLLRPLPVAARERLVTINQVDPDGRVYSAFSHPSTRDYRMRSKLVEVAANTGEQISLTIGGESTLTFAFIVSGNYFSVLGLTPAAGRFFTAAEDSTPGTDPVAVISYDLWQSRFGGSRSAIGQTILINGHRFTVIGVAPEKFKGTETILAAPVWIPMMMTETVSPRRGQFLANRNSVSVSMFGRLKPGSSVESATAELLMIQRALAAEFAADSANGGKSLALHPLTGMEVQMRSDMIGIMAILMSVATLVLLIACVNVSSMLLARALGRRREIAIRSALGAGRGRIIRQLLVESTLLFLVGGGAGVLLAFWTTDLLLAFKPPVDFPLELDLSVDLTVLGFTLLVSLLCGTIFGLVPAIPATRTQLAGMMKDSVGGGNRLRLRNIFVVSQVAISLLLLVSAGLFLRTLYSAQDVDPGFEPDDLYVVPMQPSLNGYDAAREKALYEELASRIASRPGVESVAFTSIVPLGLAGMNTSITYEGEPIEGSPSHTSSVSFISPGYFRTLGMQLTMGRDFTPTDREGAPQVAIVNQAMAEAFWPGENPIGKRISQASPSGPFLEIVGVARNGKYESVNEQQRLALYRPVAQERQSNLTMLIRMRPGSPSPLADARRMIRSIDPNLAVMESMPMREMTSIALLPQRMAAVITGIFGLLGLTLAAVGIYGLVAYSVAQRTHEIGIRAALGAERRDLVMMIIRQGFLPVAIGVAIGLAGSLALTHLLESLLIGISPSDPVTLVGVSLLLVSTALLACYIPARRATLIDPMSALRYE